MAYLLDVKGANSLTKVTFQLFYHGTYVDGISTIANLAGCFRRSTARGKSIAK